MSNLLIIVPTRFVDLVSDESSCGVRVYDDVSRGYVDSLQTLPEGGLELFLELLAVADSNPAVYSILEDHRSQKNGARIGAREYSYDEIETAWRQFLGTADDENNL